MSAALSVDSSAPGSSPRLPGASCYSWGKNSSGQLGWYTEPPPPDPEDELCEGRPFRKHAAQPSPLQVSALAGVSVSHVAAGESHSLACDESGAVWSWGRGREGQLGDGSRHSRHAPLALSSLRRLHVVRVACGAFSSACVTLSGQCFQWGFLHSLEESGGGTTGALHGLAAGEGAGSSSRLRDVVNRSTTQYTAGGAGASAEADEGVVRVETKRVVVTTPRLCESLEEVCCIDVCVGFGHSAVLVRDGRIFTCGYNDRGQLGQGHRKNSPNFAPIAGELGSLRCTEVACGVAHNICLTDEGEVWVWGNHGLGQLGLGPGAGDKLVPVRNTLLLGQAGEGDAVTRHVACGAHHSLAIQAGSGRAFSWGHAEYGQHGHERAHGADLGAEERRYFFTPREVPIEPGFGKVRFSSAACGAVFTAAIDEDGGVWTWGWNEHGVLGQGTGGRGGMQPRRVDVLHRSQGLIGPSYSLAAGDTHVLVVAADGPSASHRWALGLAPLLGLGDDGDNGGGGGGCDDTADLRITCTGAPPIHAHRVIVLNRCPLLAERAAPSADGMTEVSAPGFGWPRGAVLAAVRYLYLDCLRGCPPHLLGVLARLAFALQLPRLQALCETRAGREQWRRRRDNVDLPPSTFCADMIGGEAAPTDVALRVTGGAVLGGHRVLLQRSSYFATLLGGRFGVEAAAMREGRAVDVSSWLDEDVGRLLLRWVRSGSRDVVARESAAALGEAAAYCGLHGLLEACEAVLMDGLRREEAAELGEFAEAHGMARLRAAAGELLQ